MECSKPASLAQPVPEETIGRYGGAQGDLCLRQTRCVLDKTEAKALIQQLGDPSRSDQALMALIANGRDSVPALAAFLRSTKPLSLPEPRLLAVEGLSILRGPEALEALIVVAAKHLAAISDPAIRLGEESVASRAARALADFCEPRAREALLELVKGKPLMGVAEAFERLRDPRAIPYLVAWLEEDFVWEAAGRAVVASGQAAVPILLGSLREKHCPYAVESGMSQRRRARILDLLRDLARPQRIDGLEDLLDDPVEIVRWSAVQLFLDKGDTAQRRRAFRIGMKFLSFADNLLRADCEALLLAHFSLGSDLIDEEIEKRRLKGEWAEFWPRETPLAILLRIARKSKRGG